MPNKKADCIFCKIIEGGLPSYRIYEDNDVVAFLDIFPVHPGHVLVVPKSHYTDIFDTPENEMRALIAAARKIAPAVMKATRADAINIGMNNRQAAGQVVMHAHMHVIPRFKDDGLKVWPQRPYDHDAEKEKMAAAIKDSLGAKSFAEDKKGETTLTKTLLTSILVLASAVVLFLVIRTVLCRTQVWAGGIC